MHLASKKKWCALISYLTLNKVAVLAGKLSDFSLENAEQRNSLYHQIVALLKGNPAVFSDHRHSLSNPLISLRASRNTVLFSSGRLGFWNRIIYEACWLTQNAIGQDATSLLLKRIPVDCWLRVLGFLGVEDEVIRISLVEPREGQNNTIRVERGSLWKSLQAIPTRTDACLSHNVTP